MALIPKQPGELSLKNKFFNLRSLITIGLALGFLYFILSRLDVNLGETWQNMRHASPGFYILAFVVYYLSFPLRGWRWQLMLRNSGLNPVPSVWKLTHIILLTFFTNCILYARLGEPYRAYLLKQERGAGLSQTIGTIVAERALDAVMIFLLLAIAGWELWRGQGSGPILAIGLAIVLVFVIFLILLRGLRQPLSRRLPPRLSNIYLTFHQGALGSLRRLPLLNLQGLAIWILEAGRLFFLAQALGVDLNPWLILFAAQAIGILSANRGEAQVVNVQSHMLHVKLLLLLSLNRGP
ncbi:MAG: lysylphosphatidylglycerol synthase transmembrane domain-containing protein [Chloroflexota bacterium]